MRILVRCRASFFFFFPCGIDRAALDYIIQVRRCRLLAHLLPVVEYQRVPHLNFWHVGMISSGLCVELLDQVAERIGAAFIASTCASISDHCNSVIDTAHET
jgi:hypothetical protein